jgi:Fur family transcriptional regulator, ferric uptake regulator
MLHLYYLCSNNIIVDAAQHIREKGLKVTPMRIKVLELMQHEPIAYSHAALETALEKVDRITLYRTLNDFEEAGLVHKVIDTAGTTRFALCKDNCSGAHHTDNHVHFDCQRCHKMYCLEKVVTPVVKIPRGFRAEQMNIVVQGVCADCSKA